MNEDKPAQRGHFEQADLDAAEARGYQRGRLLPPSGALREVVAEAEERGRAEGWSAGYFDGLMGKPNENPYQAESPAIELRKIDFHDGTPR